MTSPVTVGTDETVGSTTDDTTGSTGEMLPEIEWGECPIGFVEECAYIPVSIDRDDPDSVEIEVMIARRPAPSGDTEAQLWLMQGGPGGSGDAFELVGMIDELGDLLPDVDVYVIEHRGVGESAGLSCPDEQAPASPGGEVVVEEEIPSCSAFLDEAAGGALGKFSTTAAAQDVQYMLRLAREDGQRQFVYGVSYGSYLGQRFLRLFPDEVDGVILDSVAAPTQKFSEFDVQADVVGMRLAQACADDPVCSSKLGDDPWTALSDAVAALEGGQCAAAGLTGPLVPSILWQLLDERELRETVLPLLYRLQRCEPEDLAAVTAFFNYLPTHGPQIPKEWPNRLSILLQYNITVADFWRYPFDGDALIDACTDAVFCPGLSARVIPFAENWPVYEDEHIDQWPDTETPVLAFDGDYDIRTPIETASELVDHLQGPNQNFYEVPEGTHWILYTTPVQTKGQPTCGMQLLRDFIADPSSAPDASCLDDLVRLDVAGDADKAMRYFDAADMWENLAGNVGPAPRRTPADWQRAVQRLRPY